MNTAASGLKRRWLVAAGGGLLIVVALAWLFSVPPHAEPLKTATAARPPITVRTGQADELAMRDLAPLFLPTIHNAAAADVISVEPNGSFRDPPPKLTFSADDPVLPLPPPIQVPAKPADTLRDTPGALAFGIGRTDQSLPAAAARGAYVDVFAARTGERVFRDTFAIDARPSTGAANGGWHPLEFLAAVDSVGLIGSLTLTSGSGVEDVDNYFRNYLAENFRIGDRLPPGFYRVVIGP